MKKNIGILSAVLVLMLTSCTTLVKVNTLMPAEINLASYDCVGVASTDGGSSINFDFSYRSRLSSEEKKFLPYYTTTPVIFTPDVSDYATRAVSQAVGDSIGDYVNSYTVDALIKAGKKKSDTVRFELENAGIDCLVTSKITGKDVCQYIDTRDDEVKAKDGSVTKERRYYLVQEASVELTVEVTDVAKNSKVFSKFFKDSDEREIYIGKVENGGAFQQEKYFYSRLETDEIFKDLLLGMRQRIKRCFTQYSVSNRFYLEKSKSEEIKTGIELAHEGLYEEALEIFLDEWESSKSFESGYNSAIMYFALGEFEEATDFAYRVYRKTYNEDAMELCRKFSSIAEADEKAKDQIDGVLNTQEKEELVGF